jgi:hypothetical protein
MPMDEPVPIRRVLVGFALIALLVIAVMLLVRPAIFSLAPPRDDTVVPVGTQNEVSMTTRRIEVVLSDSYGWDGEQDAGDGRTQLGVIVGPTATGIAAVNATSPVAEDCPVEITADRLTDCDGRSWTFAGLPINSADPPLERFPITVDGGSVFVDFTRTIDG